MELVLLANFVFPEFSVDPLLVIFIISPYLCLKLLYPILEKFIFEAYFLPLVRRGPALQLLELLIKLLKNILVSEEFSLEFFLFLFCFFYFYQEFRLLRKVCLAFSFNLQQCFLVLVFLDFKLHC